MLYRKIVKNKCHKSNHTCATLKVTKSKNCSAQNQKNLRKLALYSTNRQIQEMHLEENLTEMYELKSEYRKMAQGYFQGRIHINMAFIESEFKASARKI